MKVTSACSCESTSSVVSSIGPDSGEPGLPADTGRSASRRPVSTTGGTRVFVWNPSGWKRVSPREVPKYSSPPRERNAAPRMQMRPVTPSRSSKASTAAPAGAATAPLSRASPPLVPTQMFPDASSVMLATFGFGRPSLSP